MMSAAACNAILDPIFIFGFGPIQAFGIKGAAIATVLTWVMTNLFIWYHLAKQEKMLKFMAWCKKLVPELDAVIEDCLAPPR